MMEGPLIYGILTGKSDEANEQSGGSFSIVMY